MKKILFSLSMLIMGFGAQAQVNIGPGSSGAINQAIPVECNYGYTYSQMIYSSADINASGTITTLKFYKSGTGLANSSDWTVYLGHTTNSTFASTTSWEAVSGLTQVFSDSVVQVGSEVLVTLTTPFVYNGVDNLIIAVDENQASYDSYNDDFYCTAQSGSTAITYRSDSNNPDPATPPTATYLRAYVANVEIGGITQSCPTLVGLAANNIAATSADLDWTAGSVANYEVEYGTSGFALGAGTSSIVTTNTINVTGLTAVTGYEFYVRNICAVGDTSNWAGPFSFTTPCANYTPNYLEDFTSYIPACWSEFQGVLGATSTVVSSATNSNWAPDGFANSSSSGSARMNVYSTGRDEWLVSPTIDLGNGTTPYQLQYDVALTPFSGTGATTFGADDTLAMVISTDNGVTWSQANILQVYTAGSEPSNTGDFTIISLAGYTGLVKFGIYAASSVAGGDINVYIDNFEVRDVPNCPQPTMVVTDSVTTTKAYLSWLLGATNSVVEYGPVGFSQGSGTSVSLANGVDSLVGLMPATAYDFYIKDSCGVGNLSPWTGPVSFTTGCATYMAPYTESFDVSGTPICWTQYTNTGGPWAFSQGSGVNTACGSVSEHTGNGGYFAWMDQSSSDDSVSLEMYDIDVTALTTPYLEFYYSECLNTTAQNFLHVEAWDGSAWASIDTINQSTNGWEVFGYDISAFTYGTNLVKIRFRAESGGASNDYTADNVLDDISIMEAPTCFLPTALDASNITSNSADLSWTANTGELAWDIEWDTTGFTKGTGISVSNTGNNPYNLLGLAPITTYDFYVRGICGSADTSAWSGPFSFTTLCGIYSPTYTEDFTAYLPTCWGEFQGVLGASGTTVTNATASNWASDGFGNVGFSGSAKINLYSTGRDEWLVSPSIDLGAGTTDYLLSFDVAVTDYANTNIGPLGVDDTLAMVISTDDGATWTTGNILQMWGMGTEPSNTGDYVGVNLSGYTGVVKVGFYAASSVSNADNDLFVDNFSVSPCVHSSNTVALTVCDSYTTTSGTVYTADGTFNDTLVNAIGCDSVLTVNLTVISSSVGTDMQVACDTYTWIDGMTYTATNNTATFVLTNAVGCDSTVTLDLTINNSATGTDVIASCDPILWIDGNSYFSNTIATHTIVGGAVNGCDSIVTLDLTINNLTTGVDAITACESYTWIDGNTYTASNNTATYVLTNSVGCDSIVALYLTINQPTSSTATIVACESYTWIDGIMYTASNTTATHTLSNSVGCDSVVTLDLTINLPTVNTITATECESYMSAAGNTYTSTGMYTEVFTGANGCDSILTLDLTITNANYTVSVSSGIHLTSNQPGATYQWLDCSNGNAPIAGATNQVYIATINGDYACEVTYQTCSGTSTCVTVNSVGIEDAANTFASVYPNPVNDLLTVTLSDLDNAQFELMDVQGKMIMSSTINNGEQIDMSNLESGIYFVRLISNENRMIKRVVKN